MKRKINDASQGTMNSYAYSLLVLYFLQVFSFLLLFFTPFSFSTSSWFSICVCVCVCMRVHTPNKAPSQPLSLSLSLSLSHTHTHTHTHTSQRQDPPVLPMLNQKRPEAMPRKWHTFSTVLNIAFLLFFYSKYTRALTFQNFCQKRQRRNEILKSARYSVFI